MTPYLLVFGLFLAGYLMVEAVSPDGHITFGERWVLLLPLAVFSIIYAGRIGTDADSYGLLFDASQDFPVEPGFSMLMTGAKSIGLDYIGFVKLLAVGQILLLGSIVKRLRDPLFFLLFYVSSFFLNFEFNAIRNSFALLIIGALYVRLQRPSVVALVSASAIYYSSVITLGLQKLALSKRQVMATGVVILAGGFFALLWLRPELVGDQLNGLLVYQGYLEEDFETKKIYTALLLKLVVVWIFYRNGGNRLYFIAYAVLVLMVHLISPILSRISDLVLFLALLDFCMRHELLRSRVVAVGLSLILVVSSLLIPWNDCQNGGTDNWCLSGQVQ